ncbi:hypothetical protein C8J57DRAFT_1304105 [Mycena rebaudengoi]|nr:hypothetical protein C8J57DRAFT_1304105 [Mycena rebaudengoi]
MLVFDVMIFMLTLYKALRYENTHREPFRRFASRWCVSVGLILFILLKFVRLYVLWPYERLSNSDRNSVRSATLSSVLISRLMLNLRDPKILRLAQRNRTARVTTENLPAMTTLMDTDNGRTRCVDRRHSEYEMQAMPISGHR